MKNALARNICIWYHICVPRRFKIKIRSPVLPFPPFLKKIILPESLVFSGTGCHVSYQALLLLLDVIAWRFSRNWVTHIRQPRKGSPLHWRFEAQVLTKKQREERLVLLHYSNLMVFCNSRVAQDEVAGVLTLSRGSSRGLWACTFAWYNEKKLLPVLLWFFYFWRFFSFGFKQFATLFEFTNILYAIIKRWCCGKVQFLLFYYFLLFGFY